MDKVIIVAVNHVLITWSSHSHVACLSLPTLHYKPLQCLHCLGSTIKKMCLFALNIFVTLDLLQVCCPCSMCMCLCLCVCVLMKFLNISWKNSLLMWASSIAMIVYDLSVPNYNNVYIMLKLSSRVFAPPYCKIYLQRAAQFSSGLPLQQYHVCMCMCVWLSVCLAFLLLSCVHLWCSIYQV